VSLLLPCRRGLIEFPDELRWRTEEEQEKKMVKVVFEYNVPKEKQAEYLQLTQERIRPFWEAHGCQSYSVWSVAESETGFVKEMLFENMSAMKETMSLKEAEPVKEIYFKFALDVSRRIITKKV
jgi:quinol monooxygenase YgiN